MWPLQTENPLFFLTIGRPIPLDILEKGLFCFTWPSIYFIFLLESVFISIGPQIYACIKQGKLKTLVATMTLYKLPSTEAYTNPLPMSAPIIPNEGHAKYVCMDPWINVLVTLASLGTIVAYLMFRCRWRTLCRGLEYATACHIHVFISRNERYSTIKLGSTMGLPYNFVTNQRLSMEALELHKGCPQDSLHINWGGITLTNGNTSNECDCKWVCRPMGGSVIRIDIPCNTVSVDCNIKST